MSVTEKLSRRDFARLLTLSGSDEIDRTVGAIKKYMTSGV